MYGMFKVTESVKIKKNNTSGSSKISIKSKSLSSSATIGHPISDSKINISLVSITPTMAEAILNSNHTENRNVIYSPP
jgi:uncharacterized protein involved in exopolysaccharide biosynthesis